MALNATEETWRSSYLGAPSGRVDRAVAELEGFASDGELDGLGVA
jgi:hypothetical protein